MSAIQALIVICLLVAVSFWLQRISDALLDIAKVLEKWRLIGIHLSKITETLGAIAEILETISEKGMEENRHESR